ncbi:hypothetical protein [Planococcus sp. SSTMD024]|uniref:hypothetical protein n=1 Tax=Planococcus sp. SSTMD024 TaxID=3242163 RepID=UPI00351F73C7
MADNSAVRNAEDIPLKKRFLFGVFWCALTRGETQMIHNYDSTNFYEDSRHKAWERECSILASDKKKRIVQFFGYDNEGRAVNQLDIWLTTMEMPIFFDALIKHSFPLPTNYLHTLEEAEGGFHVRIRTHESSKVFVARLSSVINCLEQSVQLYQYK